MTEADLAVGPARPGRECGAVADFVIIPAEVDGLLVFVDDFADHNVSTRTAPRLVFLTVSLVGVFAEAIFLILASQLSWFPWFIVGGIILAAVLAIGGRMLGPREVGDLLRVLAIDRTRQCLVDLVIRRDSGAVEFAEAVSFEQGGPWCGQIRHSLVPNIPAVYARFGDAVWIIAATRAEGSIERYRGHLLELGVPVRDGLNPCGYYYKLHKDFDFREWRVLVDRRVSEPESVQRCNEILSPTDLSVVAQAARAIIAERA